MNKKVIKLGVVNKVSNTNKVSNVSKVSKSIKTENQELINELSVAKEMIKSLETQRYYLLKCFAKICQMCKQNEIIKQTFNDFKNVMKTKTTKYVVIGVKTNSNLSYKPIEVEKPSDTPMKKMRPGRPYSNPYYRAFNAKKTTPKTRHVPESPPPAPEVTDNGIDITDNIFEIKQEVESDTEEINDNISLTVEGIN